MNEIPDGFCSAAPEQDNILGTTGQRKHLKVDDKLIEGDDPREEEVGDLGTHQDFNLPSQDLGETARTQCD